MQPLSMQKLYLFFVMLSVYRAGTVFVARVNIQNISISAARKYDKIIRVAFIRNRNCTLQGITKEFFYQACITGFSSVCAYHRYRTLSTQKRSPILCHTRLVLFSNN